MRFQHILLIFFLSYSSLSAATIPEGTTINSCGDGGGWPPYTYETPNNEVVGYDVDILGKIFSKHKLKSRIEMTAWKRCLKLADEGREYQMVPSSSFNKERDKTYLLTRHYYTITPGFFYIAKNFPNGLKIKKVSDFKKYNVCGLLGYNYSSFRVPKEDIETGTRSFDQVVEKTHRERCDLFLARYELFAGFAKMGTDYIQDYGLKFSSIPGVESEKFHIMISRNYQYAKELKELLDKEISLLDAKGQLQPMVLESINNIEEHFSRN